MIFCSARSHSGDSKRTPKKSLTITPAENKSFPFSDSISRVWLLIYWYCVFMVFPPLPALPRSFWFMPTDPRRPFHFHSANERIRGESILPFRKRKTEKDHSERSDNKRKGKARGEEKEWWHVGTREMLMPESLRMDSHFGVFWLRWRLSPPRPRRERLQQEEGARSSSQISIDDKATTEERYVPPSRIIN